MGTTQSHDDRLAKAGLPSLATLTDTILGVWSQATDSDLESGASWYGEAAELAATLAAKSGVSVEHAASVISHLSPRTTWARNVMGATELLLHGRQGPGIMSAGYGRAVKALESDNPLETFGGPKTRAFAANISGDTEAVTVDVWACRVAGISDKLLGRVGVYDAVAEAYRLAARSVGVTPRTMQATTWVTARGGRVH